MRFDSVGLFWQDAERVKGKNQVARVMPPIPDTGWQPLRDLPNLSRAKVLGIDTETKDESFEAGHGPGWAKGQGYIAGISVAADDDGAWYFPIRHSINPEQNYDPERILKWLGYHVADKVRPNIFANALYDVGWLAQEGVQVQGPIYDVQFAEALIHEEEFVALDKLCKKYRGTSKESDLLMQWLADYYGGEPTLSQRKNIWRSPPALAAPYGVGDVVELKNILADQWKLLYRDGLLDLFEMECALIPLLVAMRFAGVSVDVPQAERVYGELEKEEARLQGDFDKLCGFPVNVDAADDIAKAFRSFNLPYNLTEKTQRPSFTKDFLKTVTHPVGKFIRDIRAVARTRNVYVKNCVLDSHIGGKVHPLFHPLKDDTNGAKTGRFSASYPPLQQQPAKDEEIGKLIRGFYVPDAGHKQWRKFDYSQLQYRWLAHYAVGPGSDELRNAYNTDPDTDFHNEVQATVKRVVNQDIPRRPIKNVNFGITFGMGEDHTCELMGLPHDQAKALLQAVHEAAPYLKATLRACAEEAQELGEIRTILGRRTHFDLWEPKQWGDQRPALPYDRALVEYGRIRRASTHKALNYRLQGSEGDIMKRAMLWGWRDGIFAVTGVPRLTVHDELDFSDTGEPGTEEAFRELQHIMETCIKARIPITVDCDTGANWGACL